MNQLTTWQLVIGLSILMILAIYLINQIFLFPSSSHEAFTMSLPCPNSFKRNALQCRQCSDLTWCHNDEGQGICVPKADTRGCQKLTIKSRPDPIKEAHLYLPGQRGFWWWTLSEPEREVLKNAVNIPQRIIP
jgi:hypothetical protein